MLKLVFARHPYVAALHARNLTAGRALDFLVGSGKIEHIAVKHRREVRAARVEQSGVAHHISRLIFLQLGSLARTGQLSLRVTVGRVQREILLISLDGLRIGPLPVERLGQTQHYRTVGITITQSILIGSRGAGILSKPTVALGHLVCHLRALRTLLARLEFIVNLPVSLGRVKILSALHLLVGHTHLSPVTRAHDQPEGQYI